MSDRFFECCSRLWNFYELLHFFSFQKRLSGNLKKKYFKLIINETTKQRIPVITSENIDGNRHHDPRNADGTRLIGAMGKIQNLSSQFEKIVFF